MAGETARTLMPLFEVWSRTPIIMRLLHRKPPTYENSDHG